MTFHDALIARTYLLRGAVLWLLARLLISMVILLAKADPFALSPRASAIIILVSTTLACAQTLRLHELVLLGNLGVPRAQLALYFAVPALAGELILGATHALLA